MKRSVGKLPLVGLIRLVHFFLTSSKFLVDWYKFVCHWHLKALARKEFEPGVSILMASF